MFEFFAGIFGYVLSFLYNFVQNYGLAMILFTILIKLLMLPLTIKQQKTLKMNSKLQEEIKVIQFKYKNDQEKMNSEMMKLYKDKNMSPFSGCLGTILQFILLLSVFYLVRCPLTYMQKIPAELITSYQNQIKEDGRVLSNNYPEIDIIRESDWLIEKNKDDEHVSKTNINMNFLGLDLSKIPQQNMSDLTVYIIPVLYIISSFISIRMTTAMQQGNKKKEEKEEVIDITENNDEKGLAEVEKKPVDTMAQTNKMMNWMMPILSISIAFIAPLGLALYWLVNNLFMIGERILIDKFTKKEEE